MKTSIYNIYFMKNKKTILSFCLLALMALQITPFDTEVEAANEEFSAIENIRVTISGDNVNIFWDRLDSDEESNIPGYVITWGTRKSEVRADEIGRIYEDNYSNSKSVRLGTFDRNEDYYFRIFGNSNNNKYQNLYASKILKWSYTGSGATESEILEPEDPIIVNNSTAEEEEDLSVYDFGALRATPFDTIVRFFWSEPDLTDNEYDNIVIIISEQNDLSNPVLEAEIGKSYTKARIDNLKPGTQYYAKAVYENEGSRFGDSDTINILTYSEADETGKRRLATILDNIAESEGFGKIIDAQQYTSSGTTSTTTTTSTTSTSSSSSSNLSIPSSTSSSDFVVPDNAADINDELRRLRAEMGIREVQTRKLLLKLREIQQ